MEKWGIFICDLGEEGICGYESVCLARCKTEPIIHELRRGPALPAADDEGTSTTRADDSYYGPRFMKQGLPVLHSV